MKSIKGEISNNFLALLVAAAIVVVLAGFMMPIKTTGYAGNTGTLSGTLGTTTAINFTNNTVNFGTITVPGMTPSCEVDTETHTNCSGATAPANGFVVENTGNKDVSLQLATGKNASDLLGGTTPKYQWKVSNTTEANSCTGAANAYIDVNKSSPGTVICTNFSAYSTRDVVDIAVKLVVPSDGAPGSISDTFTATATAMA
jgi:hypothetical protein